MKRFLILLLVTFCTLFFSACQSQNEEITLLDNIGQIAISESNGFGGLNENYNISFNEADTIADIENILKNAQQVKHVNSPDKPDYDLFIQYENGDTQGLHLLFGNQGEQSKIMFIGHEKYSYTISPEDTTRLKKYLK